MMGLKVPVYTASSVNVASYIYMDRLNRTSRQDKKTA
jgi:hypothetical protein